MTFLRSLLFQVYFFASLAIATALITLGALLPFSLRFGVARVWGRGMLWVGRSLCGLEYRIEGRENIPAEPSVIFIKHSSVFETYAQLVVFPGQVWVVKRELMWLPLFGWALAAMRTIAINRHGGSAAVKQVIAQGKRRLADGIWVTVFPEGTRMTPGQTRKYGVSGAALAKAAGVKIVPVAHNAGDLWGRRSIVKYPGLIRFVIGPAIDPAGLTPKQANRLVQNWIEGTMAKISPLAYADKGDEKATP